MTLNDTLIVVSTALLVAVALRDIIARTVSDVMTIALGVMGFAMRLVDGTVLVAGAIGAAVFGAALFCWYLGALGGGDVKLLGASMLLVPPPLQLSVLLLMSLAGGAISIVYLATRQWLQYVPATKPVSFVARVWRVELWRLCRGGPIPYAVAIAAGAIGTFASEGLSQ